MTTFIRIVAGVLLIAHGLVHLLYVASDVPEFSFDRSWALRQPRASTVGWVLMVATIIGFVLVGLAVWGVPGLAGAWPGITVVASALSLLLMLLFWNNRLVFGVAIDVALIAIAVLRPSWTDSIG